MCIMLCSLNEDNRGLETGVEAEVDLLTIVLKDPLGNSVLLILETQSSTRLELYILLLLLEH